MWAVQKSPYGRLVVGEKSASAVGVRVGSVTVPPLTVFSVQWVGGMAAGAVSLLEAPPGPGTWA